MVDYVQAHELKVQWILETHAHADHLSAAPYLKQKLGGQTGIGDQITRVQRVFKGIFNLKLSSCPVMRIFIQSSILQPQPASR